MITSLLFNSTAFDHSNIASAPPSLISNELPLITGFPVNFTKLLIRVDLPTPSEPSKIIFIFYSPFKLILLYVYCTTLPPSSQEQVTHVVQYFLFNNFDCCCTSSKLKSCIRV